MRKTAVLASVLAIAGTASYTGVKSVEGKSTDRPVVSPQTLAIVDSTTAFLTALNPNQRQKVQFAFSTPKLGVNAPFHRTADGSVAPGAPTGQQVGRSGADGPDSPGDQGHGLGGGPGGPGRGPGGGPGMGPRVVLSANNTVRPFGRTIP